MSQACVHAFHHTFGVLGGDQRQVYLANSIAADGYPVLASCLEKAQGLSGVGQASPDELARRCSVILLPLPATRDGKALNAPLSARQVALDDAFAGLLAGRQVLGGMLPKLLASSPCWEEVAPVDYYDREELLTGNAVLTAEGAIGSAIAAHPGALNGSRCLVTGFGRIGKALCLGLRGLGAHVDCAARKPWDFTAIQALGCGAVRYGEIGGGYDVIFNTVPAPVLDAPALSKQGSGTLLLELASAPGGIDLPAAERLGLRVLPEPSLPGRASPKAAGELIKETVYNILQGC